MTNSISKSPTIISEPLSETIPVSPESVSEKLSKSSEWTTLAISTIRKGIPSMKRSEALIIKDLQDIDNQLSPENLTCDGELSSSEVEARQKLL